MGGGKRGVFLVNFKKGGKIFPVFFLDCESRRKSEDGEKAGL